MANGETVDYGQLSASGAAEYLKDTAAVRQTMQMAAQAVEQALERQDQQFRDTHQDYEEPANERFARIQIGGKTVDQLLDERFPNANLDVYHRKQMGLLLITRAQIEGKQVRVSPFADRLGRGAAVLGATGLSAQLIKPIKLTGWKGFWSKLGLYKREAAEVRAANEKQTELFSQMENTTLASNINNPRVRQDNKDLVAQQTPVYQEMFLNIQSTQVAIDRQFVAGVEHSCFLKPEHQSGEKQALTMAAVQSGGPMRGRFLPKICVLMMLDRGCTLEDAVDPTKHVELRAEIGRELGEWGKACASEDPAVSKPAQERYEEFLLRTSQLLLDQKAPTQEQIRTMKNPNLLYSISYIGYDAFQELHYISPERKEHPRYELLRQRLSNLGRMGMPCAIVTGLSTDQGKWRITPENASAEDKADRAATLADDTLNFMILSAHAMSTTPVQGATLQEYADKNPESGARNSDLQWVYEGMLAELDCADRPVVSLRDVQAGKVDIEPIIRNNQAFANQVDGAAHEYAGSGNTMERQAKITLAESLVQKLGVDPVNAKAQFDKCTTEMFNNPAFEQLAANQSAEKLVNLSKNPEALDQMLQGIKPPISVSPVEKAASMNKEMQAQPKAQPKPHVPG